MKPKDRFRVLGLMSGTSLDGLDIVCCEFSKTKTWTFRILSSQTYAYSEEWDAKLRGAHLLSASALLELHTAYGNFLGKQCLKFLRSKKITKIDFISSHGHTIFHQPQNGFTFQLGDGSALYAAAGLPVVCDFRSLDVALGGEGAPLVPMGDRLLFSSYDVCLNLGGIANLSTETKGERRAFDICFCNMAMNFLMNGAGKRLDRNGVLASQGKIDDGLLTAISKIYAPLYHKRPSIGRELFEQALQPLLASSSVTLEDRLHTVAMSAVQEIERSLPAGKKLKLLATGGGAHNAFLMSLLRRRLAPRVDVTIPPKVIVDFKEALVFAFLGVLRVRNEVNVLSSVTHAAKDSSSGIVLGR